MLARFTLWSGLILSWLSIFFIPKQNIIRFMPVAILSSFLVTMVYELAYQFGWWKLKKLIAPWMKVTDLSFVFGPFLIGTIWVFHLTYKIGFFIYILSNMMLDSFFFFS